MRRATLYMDLEEWKKQATIDPESVKGVGLKKIFSDIECKAINDEQRTVRFVISNQNPDREKDVIGIRGWKTEAFLRNPVIPFGHDYHSLPVGKALDLTIQGNALLSTAQFVSREIYPFADTVFQMIKGGFLNAVSVGFRPLKHEVNKERGGIDFLEQELLEYSVVPVPCHPEALVAARAAGIDTDPLKAWAEQVLDEVHGEVMMTVPKASLEEIVKLLKPTYTVGFKIQTDDDPAPEVADKAVPPDISHERAAEDESFSRPTLASFTNEGWNSLSATERRRIAKHFAWAKQLPPENFSELRFAHHSPEDGKIVWQGVRGAMAGLLSRRGQPAVPEEEREAVYAHLAKHYDEFDKTPPEFREYEPSEFKDLVQACGVPQDEEIDVLVQACAEGEEIVNEVMKEASSPEPESEESLNKEIAEALATSEVERTIAEALTTSEVERTIVTPITGDSPVLGDTSVAPAKSTLDLPEVVIQTLKEAGYEYDSETKTVKAVVGQKINPTALSNPLPESYEWTIVQLAQAAKNFLTANGIEVRDHVDAVIPISTFKDKFIMCVIGRDRPFADDPCYQASYGVNRRVGGLPQFKGEPELVEIQVTAQLVQLGLLSAGLSSEILAEKEASSNPAVLAVTRNVGVPETGETDVFGFLQTENPELVKEALSEVVTNGIHTSIAATVEKSINNLRGRID